MTLAVKEAQRIRRHGRVKRKIMGTSEKPRLCVHRSGKNFQCQVVDDLKRRPIFTFTTLDKKFKPPSPKKNTVEAAKSFGKFVSEELKTKGISKISRYEL